MILAGSCKIGDDFTFGHDRASGKRDTIVPFGAFGLLDTIVLHTKNNHSSSPKEDCKFFKHGNCKLD